MRVLILHGWQGSPAPHWQAWLADELGDDAVFPELPNADEPRLEEWLAALDEIARPDDVVVCHSLACILWLHARRSAARVFLVAPPSAFAEIADFFPAPLDPVENALLVCSDNDPYCPEGAAALYGDVAPVKLIPGAGHINPESGYGPWPWILQGAKNGVET